MRKLVGFVAMVGLVMGVGRVASAGSATASMNVTARVTNACTIAAGTMAFGDYNPTSLVPVTATTNLQVTCTLGAVASIALDQGTSPASGSTAVAPQRQMANGSERLQYTLTQDLTGLVTFGGGASAEAYLGVGIQTNVPVYGKIAASQVVAAGNFSDVVTATISF